MRYLSQPRIASLLGFLATAFPLGAPLASFWPRDHRWRGPPGVGALWKTPWITVENPLIDW